MKRVALTLLFLTSCSSHKASLEQKPGFLVAPMIPYSRDVDLGVINRTTLPNGLEVISIPRKEKTVQIGLAIIAGHSSDPLDMSGLSEFTASMLRKGTTKRSAAQIAETIDFVGGSIATTAGNDAVFIQCSARSQDLAVCLDLMTDLIQNPAFLQKEIDLLKQQFVGNIQGSKDSPGSLGSDHAANVYWGDNNVLGRPMSLQSLANINRKAIVDFFNAWYAPNNAVLAISGDFDPSVVEKAFSDWKKKNVPKTADRRFPEKGELKVRVVDKPDATQSTILIQGPGISRRNKDFCAVELMNYALGGGGFSSRLMKVVRSEGGKTYGASSSFPSGRDPGPFSISTFTRNSETGATLKLLFREIDKMRAEGPTQDELDAAKSNTIGGFGLNIETGSDLAFLLLKGKVVQLDDDFLKSYVPCMSDVTVAQASGAAAHYLFPTTLVVVGNAKEVVPQLKDMGLTVHETILFTDTVSASERRKS